MRRSEVAGLAVVAVAAGIFALPTLARGDADDGTLRVCWSGLEPRNDVAWAEGPTAKRSPLGPDSCRSWSVRPGSYDVGIQAAEDAPVPRPVCRDAEASIERVTVTRPGLYRVNQGHHPSVRTNVAPDEATTVTFTLADHCPPS